MNEHAEIKSNRHYTTIDAFCLEADKALKTLFGAPRQLSRPNPADSVEDALGLSLKEQRETARLLRVDHCGEVCAQALYQGQALTAHLPETRDQMQQSADEENDHLAWCEARLTELQAKPSRLNPLFYLGSLTIGGFAGLMGDKWSLGFVAETEKQVVNHLTSHQEKTPTADQKTHAILKQMKADEQHHQTLATQAGGANLPMPLKFFMRIFSKIMTKTTYWI